jgi:hypothetical protein
MGSIRLNRRCREGPPAVFSGLDPQVLAAATERYRNLKVWKETPLVEEEPVDIWQDLLIKAGLLEASKRAKYQDLVLTDFARREHRDRRPRSVNL